MNCEPYLWLDHLKRHDWPSKRGKSLDLKISFPGIATDSTSKLFERFFLRIQFRKRALALALGMVDIIRQKVNYTL